MQMLIKCVTTGRRPAVTVSYLHESFQLGRRVVRGTVCHRLIVRVLNKSHLMYFGRADQNCDCPYKVSGRRLIHGRGGGTRVGHGD